MKKNLALALFIILLPLASFAQTKEAGRGTAPPVQPDGMSAPREGSFEPELVNVERELAEAFRRHDDAGLKRLLSEDFIYTDAAAPGQPVKKTQYIENALAVKVESFNFNQTAAHAFGNTFIVSALYTQAVNTVAGGSRSRTDEFFITDVWLKRENRWQIVARYASRSAIAEPLRFDEQARINQRVKVDPKIYDAYVGKYELAPNVTLNIIREGDKLISQVNGQAKLELLPFSEAAFYLKEFNVQMTFVPDEKGQVAYIMLDQNGEERRAQKIK